jgi:hypothetical protein
MSCGPRWLGAHCHGTELAVVEAVFPAVFYLLRLGVAGWDVGIDSLATQLVIQGSWPHGATP